jgi:hypothetical protein
MTTTALQFGPEWMRKAPLSTPPTSAPPGAASSTNAGGAASSLKSSVPGGISTSPAANTTSALPGTGLGPVSQAATLQEAEGRSSSYSSILSDFGQGPVTPVMALEEDGGRPFRCVLMLRGVILRAELWPDQVLEGADGLCVEGGRWAR